MYFFQENEMSPGCVIYVVNSKSGKFIPAKYEVKEGKKGLKFVKIWQGEKFKTYSDAKDSLYDVYYNDPNTIDGNKYWLPFVDMRYRKIEWYDVPEDPPYQNPRKLPMFIHYD